MPASSPTERSVQSTLNPCTARRRHALLSWVSSRPPAQQGLQQRQGTPAGTPIQRQSPDHPASCPSSPGREDTPHLVGGPARVHALHHLRPVHGIHTPCPRVDGQHGAVGVVGPSKQPPQLPPAHSSVAGDAVLAAVAAGTPPGRAWPLRNHQQAAAQGAGLKGQELSHWQRAGRPLPRRPGLQQHALFKAGVEGSQAPQGLRQHLCVRVAQLQQLQRKLGFGCSGQGRQGCGPWSARLVPRCRWQAVPGWSSRHTARMQPGQGAAVRGRAPRGACWVLAPHPAGPQRPARG
jgi:hypothetical protein